MISIIAAVSNNNVLGRDNQIIWQIPADLQYFKSITQGHVVIMGRKTFESLEKPLSNRTNIVVTRQHDYAGEGIIIAHSVQEAIKKARNFNEEEIFIIGGGEIYRQCLPFTDRIYLTKIHAVYAGDTYFPEFDEDEWKVIKEEHHEADQKNKHPYTFLVYQRNK